MVAAAPLGPGWLPRGPLILAWPLWLFLSLEHITHFKPTRPLTSWTPRVPSPIPRSLSSAFSQSNCDIWKAAHQRMQYGFHFPPSSFKKHRTHIKGLFSLSNLLLDLRVSYQLCILPVFVTCENTGHWIPSALPSCFILVFGRNGQALVTRSSRVESLRSDVRPTWIGELLRRVLVSDRWPLFSPRSFGQIRWGL